MQVAGFREVESTAEHALLKRGERALLVPRDGGLAAQAVFSLLNDAGMAPLTFVTLLNHLCADRPTGA